MVEKVTANIGFEKKIWDAACVLRGNMDASEYKSVVLGLIFLKYISDRFEEKYQQLIEEGDGFEEIIFRGYAAGILRRLYGGMVAWILSALIFGLVHVIPSVALTATFSGLVLSFFYLRYRSLVMVIMLHAMNNITACFLHSVDLGDVTFRELVGGGTLYWTIFAFCTVVSVASLVRMGKTVQGIKSDNYQPKV